MSKHLNIILLLIIVALSGYIFTSIPDRSEKKEAEEKKAEEKPATLTGYKVYTFKMPKEMDFAGEPVPLHEPDVLERLDREIHINLYFHSNSIILFKRANRWLPQIAEILREEGIPEDFKYLPLIESSLENAISYRHAVGFWQFREATAKELGLEVNREVDERYHPLKSTEAAVKYIKRSYRKFENWTNVAASYNIGMYGLQKRLEAQKVDSYYDLLLNEETARYVFRILAIKEIMSDPEKYGYLFPESHLYQIEPIKKVVVTETISDLVDYALDQGINYKLLKRFNPWLRTDRLTVRNGESYTLFIPVREKETAAPFLRSNKSS